MKSSEKEIKELGGLLIGLKKGMEQLTEEIKETAAMRGKEESGSLDASILKKKGEMDEGEFEPLTENM